MATVKDVAAAAGVSQATVSYALRGDSRIIPSTAKKVFEAADRLHYSTNLSARSLRSGKNGIIGVAIYELDMPYPSQISAAISQEVSRRGLQTIVQQTSSSVQNEISVLANVTSQLCDGTIFSPSKVTNQGIKALAGGKPVVLLDNSELSSHPLFDTVLSPCEDGAETAINHLIDIGCRHIGIIGTRYDIASDASAASQVAYRRLSGCMAAFRKAGISLDPHDVIETSWRPEEVRSVIGNMTAEGRRYDGLFCMTDSIALGTIRGLADYGLRSPIDTAVVGFDGIHEGELAVPSISTIAVDFEDLAAKAVNLLMKRILHPEDEYSPVVETARYSLVARESTAIRE